MSISKLTAAAKKKAEDEAKKKAEEAKKKAEAAAAAQKAKEATKKAASTAVTKTAQKATGKAANTQKTGNTGQKVATTQAKKGNEKHKYAVTGTTGTQGKKKEATQEKKAQTVNRTLTGYVPNASSNKKIGELAQKVKQKTVRTHFERNYQNLENKFAGDLNTRAEQKDRSPFYYSRRKQEADAKAAAQGPQSLTDYKQSPRYYFRSGIVDPMTLAKSDSITGRNPAKTAPRLAEAQKAQAAARKKQEENNYKRYASVPLSDADKKLPENQRLAIQRERKAWEKARDAGDIRGMNRAHDAAESIRLAHGYTGGKTGDEYYSPSLTVKERIQLNKEGEAALKRARLTTEQTSPQVAKDQAAQKEMEVLGKAGYQSLGSRGVNRYRLADEAMEAERENNLSFDAHGRPMAINPTAEKSYAGVSAVGYGVGGALVKAAETAVNAARNNERTRNMSQWANDAQDVERWENRLKAFDENGYDAAGGLSRESLEKKLAAARYAREQLNKMQVDPRSDYFDPTRAELQGLPTMATESLGERWLRTGQEQRAIATKNMGKVGTFLTDTAISMGQMLPSVGAAAMIPGAGPAIGAALMGGQAMGQKAYQVEQNGATSGEALIRGLGSGLIEMATEAVPLYRLAKITKGGTGKKLLGDMLTQAGIEATQESLAYIGNYAADWAARDPNRELSLAGLAESALAGAIMGGVFGGIGSIAGMPARGGANVPEASPAPAALPPGRLAALPEGVRNTEPIPLGPPLAEAAAEVAQRQSGQGMPDGVRKQMTRVRERLAQQRAAQASSAPIQTPPPEVQAMREPGRREISSRRLSATVSERDILSRNIETLGETGRRGIMIGYRDGADVSAYRRGFQEVYDQALAGRTDKEITRSSALDDMQNQAAILSGRMDRKLSIEKDREVAKEAKVSRNGGLHDFQVVSQIVGKKTAQEIDQVAKAFGQRVRYVSAAEMKNPDAQGEVTGNEVRINRDYEGADAVTFIAGHEFTHRMQELAPEAYRSFRDFVMESEENRARVDAIITTYERAGERLTRDQAMDEIAADTAGSLFTDTKVMQDFIQRNRQDYNILQKAWQAIKDIVAKLTGKRRQTADENLRLLENAMDEAAKAAKTLEVESGRTQNADTRHSIKTEMSIPTDNQTQSEQFKRWFGDWQNDPENASKVVNEDGTPKVVYRGDSEDFTVFDQKKTSYSNLYGRGFYFTDVPSHAGQYGNIRTFYLDIKHPLAPGGTRVDPAQMRAFLEEVASNEDEYDFYNYGKTATVDSVLESLRGKDAFSAIQDVNATAIGDMTAAVQLFNEVNGTNYDGIITPTETVVFEPTQIKSATDNVGTFDPDNSDIRYSIKSPGVTGQDAAQLARENARLQKDLEHWKAQVKRTDRRDVDPKSLVQMARRLRKDYSTEIDTDQLAERLGEIYNGITHDMSYDQAQKKAKTLASDMIEQASVTEDYLYHEYEPMRKYFRDTPLVLSPADSGQITDFNDFRKAVFGKLRIQKGAQSNVDQVYQELSERWPEWFDEQRESNSLDQVERIVQVLGEVYSRDAVNPYADDMEGPANFLAAEIMNSFWEVPAVKRTFADRQYKKLEEVTGLKNRMADRWHKTVRARIEDEMNERWREAFLRKKYESALKAARRQRDQRISKIRTAQNERLLRARIIRHSRDLSGKLLRPSDNKHVPQELRGAVAKVLESINLESVYTYDPDTGKRSKNPNGTPAKRTQAFQELRLAYEAIRREGEELVLDPDLMDNISAIEGLRDRPITSLGLEELTTIWNTVKAVETSITTANKAFGQQRFATIQEAAEGLKNGMQGLRPKAQYFNAAGVADKFLGSGMRRPESFFHRMGETGDKIFHMLRKAQDKQITIMDEAKDYIGKGVKNVKARGLERDAKTFDFDGTTVTMSTAEIMSLYELMKRKQAQEHILVGGIRPDAIKRGVKQMAATEPVRLTPEQIGEITETLTEEQIKLADFLQRFMAEYLGALGNEASMAVYGYEKFGGKDYFPINVDRTQVMTDPTGEAQAATIAGRGFTKGVKPHANNALIVRSIFDVVADHTADMATYAGWLEAMENLKRIYNFTFRNEAGERTGTVKGSLERAFGKNATAYWNKLMADLNNGIHGSDDNPFNALIGNYKVSAIGANIRVFIQQPTSMLRALEDVRPDDFLAGLAKSKPGTWKKVKQYAPIAVWKDWGYFDADTGRKMKSVLFGEDGPLEVIRNKSIAPAGLMDSLAWSHLWNAMEVETGRTRKDLAKGSDAFYEAVAERFNEVIDRSQVVDGILQRSQLMRSPDALTKMATSFMSEPTVVYNRFTDAVFNLRNAQTQKDRAKAIGHLGRTTFALTSSFVALAAAQSLVDALRDEDQDEGYLEKFLQAFTGLTGEEEDLGEAVKNAALEGNLGNTFNPAGYIPFAKDLLSIVQGYKVTRMDMDSFSRLAREAGNVLKAMDGKGKNTTEHAVLRLISEGARLLGVPAANLKRDVLSVYQTYLRGAGKYEALYAVAKALYREDNSNNASTFLDIAYSARRAGDMTAYEHITGELMNALGKDQKWLEGKMTDRLAADGDLEGIKAKEFQEFTREVGKIKADIDESGKTITGSKQKKVIAYIDGLDLNKEQKSALFRTQYDSDKNNPWA